VMLDMDNVRYEKINGIMSPGSFYGSSCMEFEYSNAELCLN
jgi:hypothetical protein